MPCGRPAFGRPIDHLGSGLTRKVPNVCGHLDPKTNRLLRDGKQARTASIQRGRRRPQATRFAGGLPRNGLKAVLGVARPQGVEGLGMAGPGETLGCPWIQLAIRA
jgi:hypothetical protein